MPSFEAAQASKQLIEQDFFNQSFMSVGVGKNNELIVYLFKKIRTDNLPRDFQGFEIVYQLQDK